MEKILGVELSHKFAPIAVRERVALNKKQTLDALAELKKDCREAIILSTCNRLSVYAFTADLNPLISFFNSLGIARQYLNILPDTDISINNLFCTASGLESQAVGEHQILGQIKQALDLGRQAKSTGPVLDELVRQAIHTGKRVRLETNIGKYSASLATVGFELIEKHGYNLAESSLLVIGTGNMANLVTTVLDRSKVKSLYVASHEFDRAQKMAKEWGGQAVELSNLFSVLPQADIVIGGTQGEINLLSEQELQNSKCKRAEFALGAGQKKLFIDFGVPRNFNPGLKLHANIDLYDLDDIKKLTYEGLLKRYNEIPQAQQIINDKCLHFSEWLKNRKVAPILEAYWHNLDEIKNEELKWLFPKLGNLSDQQKDLIMRFTHRVMRRVTKSPIKGIKRIADTMHIDQNPLHTVKDIFDVNNVQIFIPKRKIVVGTRGSKLALTQTQMMVETLKKHEPQYEFITRVIRTSGDEGNIDVMGAFTTAIQQHLLKGEIDLAVHSCKDLPVENVEGLKLSAITERVPANDILISKNNLRLEELPENAVVGTGSLRRDIQLRLLRPDIQIKHIQGNVDTRIKKMEDGEYDAIVLAAAGLQRLEMLSIASQIFTFDEILPAAGQGALAIETRDEKNYISDLVALLNHEPTRIAVKAERHVLISLGGGCNYPIAVLGETKKETISIRGFYATDDGSVYVRENIKGPLNQYMRLSGELAAQIKEKSGLAAKSALREKAKK